MPRRDSPAGLVLRGSFLLPPPPHRTFFTPSHLCRAPRPQVSVRLKRREARDGYERRLPGLGMPRRHDGEEGSRGDLIVHFMVEDEGGVDK